MSPRRLLSLKTLQAGSAWIFLLIGIVLYALGYFFIRDETWQKISINIGDVLVIGVILGYLTNAAQYLEIFKEDLRKIIYGKEFLSNRRDLEDIWENATSQLYKNKFPTIQNDFLNVIKNYFPKDTVSYYYDYDIYTTIRWENKELGLIKLVDTVSFDLITDSKDSFEHSFSTWSVVSDDATKPNFINLSVNGKEPIILSDKYDENDNNLCHRLTILLSGEDRYSVKFTREKVYDIRDDYYIGFRAKYLVHNLKVVLEHPEDIDVLFTSRGTQDDYDDYILTEGKVGKKYRGIILPRQGYIFALRVKSNDNLTKTL